MKIKHYTFSLFLILLSAQLNAQDYFPPISGDVWETTSPSEFDWCQTKIDSLYNFLETENSKAFILIKDGKIVLEQYFNGHTASDTWYWASAGKTLTAFMIGIAQEEGFLSISDTTSKHLGLGWTNCTPAQEEKITIRHQLTMTTGLDDVYANDCTEDSCILYLADPGTRWAYHNAPYTLLDQVIENSTGQNLNLYTTQKVKTPTGMDGLYVPVGFNKVFFSTARSMARFGLLMLNNGNWDGNPILNDSTYLYDMTNTSQNLNESYGYLWWLNGKNSFMLPQSQFVIPGSLNNTSPTDMYSAMGKNGQFLNIIPSENMIWLRMGETPDNSLVPFTLNEDIQKYIDDLACSTSTVSIKNNDYQNLNIYPNPTKDKISIQSEDPTSPLTFKLYDTAGKVLDVKVNDGEIDLSPLVQGIYYLNVSDIKYSKTFKILKE